jgi:sugar/nucleoside kinase (ribokinase family)
MRNCRIFPALGKEVQVDDLELSLGSSSAICAVGLARLGDSVTFTAVVGDDFYGEFCIDILRRERIDVSQVLRRPDVKTGITVSITARDDRALVTYPGAIPALTAEDLPENLFTGYDHIHVSSWFLQDGLRPGLKNRFAAARGAGLTTSLDCGYDPSERWSRDLIDTLTEVDVFLPNESEILGITGCRTVEEGIRKLENHNLLLVVKLGAAGCLARCRGESFHARAYPVQVVDTTGAGDSFNAGFLHAWKRGEPISDCLHFATVCGSLSTRGIGGTATQPNEAEVQRCLRAQRNSTAA